LEERQREMNGFAEHGLDEGAFGEKGSNIVKAFDAFRKCSNSNYSLRFSPGELETISHLLLRIT